MQNTVGLRWSGTRNSQRLELLKLHFLQGLNFLWKGPSKIHLALGTSSYSVTMRWRHDYPAMRQTSKHAKWPHSRVFVTSPHQVAWEHSLTWYLNRRTEHVHCLISLTFQPPSSEHLNARARSARAWKETHGFDSSCECAFLTLQRSHAPPWADAEASIGLFYLSVVLFVNKLRSWAARSLLLRSDMPISSVDLPLWWLEDK